MSLHLVRLLLLLAAVLTPTTIAVETGSIEGHVRDVANAPLANAQVLVVGTRFAAITDTAGYYRIANIPVATYTVRAQFIGCAPDSTTVHVTANQTATIDLRLRPAATVLSEIVVTGVAGAPVPRDAVSARTYTMADAKAQAQNGVISIRGTRTDWTVREPWRRRGEPWNREQYDAIDENPFVAVAADPLSTFSIDVDRASYSNVRRFIMQDRQLPPRDAVRIEELVNYFPYSYAEPEGDAPLAIHAEVGPAPWKGQHRLVRIGLQAKRMHLENLPPSNFVFLLDVSGSMQDEDKLPLVQAAMRMLVNELRAKDRVAIVVYAGSAGVVLPSTPGNQKDAILAAIDRLQAGGR